MQSSCIGNHSHQRLFADCSKHFIPEIQKQGSWESNSIHGLRAEEELRHLWLLEPSFPFVKSQLAEHDHSYIWCGFSGRLVLSR
jgi:hypothetical protein